MPDSTIGLISDTHGLLRDEAIDALQGASLIIHAGDVGDDDILDRLRVIAPVVAVRGNMDRDSWCMELPVTTTAPPPRLRRPLTRAITSRQGPPRKARPPNRSPRTLSRPPVSPSRSARIE